MFSRLHNKDVYLGSGLGLSICNKIVNKMGGDIWVKSELDKVSTFSFNFPI
jgi:signal transduction histidine kinase